MSKSIFVSYKYEDKSWVQKLKTWNSQGLLGQGVIITSERDDYRQEGEAAIKRELKSLINGASTVLFLVGQDSHNRPWVDYEVDLANSYNKRIVVARIPGTTGAHPGKLRNYSSVPLDPSSLRSPL